MVVSLTLVTGPANSAKAQVVLDRYCAALERSPILVVPRAGDVAHYARELAERGVVFGVRVEPFSGLLREIATRGGVVSQPLGEHARQALLAGVIASARLDVLAGSAAAPGFARSLARFIGELEVRRVSPARFSAALRSWAAAGTQRGRYAQELASLYGRYRRRLNEIGRLDAELYAVAALDAITLAAPRWRDTPVFCYGFDDLSGLQLDAIETLAHKVGAQVTLSLPGEPGRAAFAGRAATLETLRPGAEEFIELGAQAGYYDAEPLFWLERTLFEPPSTSRGPGDAVALLEGGDERAEAELVADEVAALIANGFAADEVAVVTRSPGPFAELLAAALAEVGVASTAPRRAPLSSSAVGRGLLALLRCAVGEGDGAALVAWLSVPGVVGLEHAVDSFEASLRRHAVNDLGPARALWERAHGRLPALERLASSRRDAVAFLDCVSAELDALFAAPWEREAALVGEWEAAAYTSARRALAELAELARGPGGLPGGVAAVLRSLEQVDVELAAGGRDAVLICDALSIRARRVRALFVCSLQDGEFPAAAVQGRLLGTAERAELAQASGLVLADEADTLAAERYLLYALCSRPTARLRLSWHSAGDDGQTALASLFLDDIRDAFDDTLYERRRVRAAGAIGWNGGRSRSAAAARRELALAQPRRLGAVIAPIGKPERLTALRGHASHSPSALEKWADCPVSWLVERALRAGELAGDSVWIKRGARAHEVLATVFGELADRADGGALDERTLPLALALLDEALATAARAPLSGSVGVDRSEQRRLRLDLGRYLGFAARRPGTHRFWKAELKFGLEGSEQPGAVLADGALDVCGTIDRIDRDGRSGTIIVYDYKTGRGVVPASAWEKERRFQQALYMRAAEQLFGVEAVGGLYQPLRRDLRPRGAIRDDVELDAAFVANDRLDAGDLAALIDQLVLDALSAAREMDRGAIEPRPATCSPDSRCRFPTICRCAAR